MSDIAKRVRFETLRSLPFGSLSGAYTAIGSALTNPARLVKLTNDTDVNIFVSIDGTNDHIFIGPSSYALYDFGSNRTNLSGSLDIANGTRFFAREESAAATSGAVYLEVIYASIT